MLGQPMFSRDIMGQCQCCTKATMTSALEDKENLSDTTGNEDQGVCGRPLGSDSAVDSGHSSEEDEEGSCGVINSKTANNNVLDRQPRNSHSSESSGKYSLRDSIESSGDNERSNFHPARIDESPTDDMPVFAEEDDELSETLGSMHSPGIEKGETLRAIHDHNRTRKISRGSRGSSGSERGSFSSVSSVTAILKARIGRSSSLISQQDQPEAETQSTCSAVANDTKRPHRTVSLRLPRSHRKPHDSDTNLPTIYVDDSPQQSDGRRASRKSSLRRALSLLSMNSLVKHEGAGSQSQQKPQKPVQKILRQPRRRHNTVRGLSGMAIDGSNQGTRNSGGLHRSHTVYYPTATSLRYATNTRRTHSITS